MPEDKDAQYRELLALIEKAIQGEWGEYHPQVVGFALQAAAIEVLLGSIREGKELTAIAEFLGSAKSLADLALAQVKAGQPFRRMEVH